MATHRLVFRKQDQNIFLMIKNRKKKVETRAGSPKYLNYLVSDKIKFVCGEEEFTRGIRKITVFKNLRSLFKTYDYKLIHPTAKNELALRKLINSFPDYQQRIKKHGIIALELK